MINSLGFIGHPIDMEHFYRMMGYLSPLTKRISAFRLKEFLKLVPSYRLSTVKNIRSSKDSLIDCHTIICPLLPSDMVALPEEFVLNRITHAIKKAEKLGAKIVTLGGFTSVIGNEGKKLAERVGIAVTSGNTYTASLAIDGIIKAAYCMNVDLNKSTLAVIGATGDIGSICTRILSKKVKRINIAARNEDKLAEFAESLRIESDTEIQVYRYTKDALLDADIVLTVTSATSVVIDSKILKPGAIICDVAIPANIAKEIVKLRDDIFVFEGGLAKLPYQSEIKDRRFNDLMPTGSIYGCLAEGVILAFEGKFENYSIGRGNITEENVAEISGIAKKHGLQLAEFFCGFKFYSEDDIEAIKRNARRNILNGKFAKR